MTKVSKEREKTEREREKKEKKKERKREREREGEREREDTQREDGREKNRREEVVTVCAIARGKLRFPTRRSGKKAKRVHTTHNAAKSNTILTRVQALVDWPVLRQAAPPRSVVCAALPAASRCSPCSSPSPSSSCARRR